MKGQIIVGFTIEHRIYDMHNIDIILVFLVPEIMFWLLNS